MRFARLHTLDLFFLKEVSIQDFPGEWPDVISDGKYFFVKAADMTDHGKLSYRAASMYLVQKEQA